MKTTHKVTLTLHQDAAIGDGRAGGQLRTSRDHVPGWVLRGALAAAWIREHGAPGPQNSRRAEFISLFESSEGARFNPLYGAGAPVGLSVLEHKRGRGCGRHLDAIDFQPGEVPTECDRTTGGCGATLEHTKGATPKSAGTVRRDFTSALAADETPLDGKLYGRESLSYSQVPVLQGFVGVAKEQRGTLNRLGQRIIIGGGGSTRGLGTLEITDDPHVEGSEHVELRQGEHRESSDLVLRLASPGIFVDGLGRPSREPSVQEVEDVLGVGVASDASGPVIRSWVRWVTEGGWHAASGLPKPTERAVAAGSTYLITLTATPNAANLRSLAEQGLGLRRNEGFGSLIADSYAASRAPKVARMFGASRFFDASAGFRKGVVERMRVLGHARAIEPYAAAPAMFAAPPLGLSEAMQEFFQAIAELGSAELIELAEILEAR